MDDDLKTVLKVVAVIAAVVTLIATPCLIGYGMNNKHVERMAAQGYVQSYLPGSTNYTWVKGDK